MSSTTPFCDQEVGQLRQAPGGKRGLRHQAWTAGPDLCRAGSVPDDSAVEQESQPVIAEVPKSARSSLDLLHLEVDRLGRSARRAGTHPAPSTPKSSRSNPSWYRS